MSLRSPEQQYDGLKESLSNSRRKVVYVPPSDSFKSLDSISKHGQRSAIVHSLIRACGLEGLCDVQPLRVATLSEALLAHTRHYLSILRGASTFYHGEVDEDCAFSELDDIDFGNEEERRMLLEEAGLIDDCPIFPGVWELGLLTVGGAVIAAERLISNGAKVACWFDGGRHHAMYDSAHGFCYLNDAVVACKVLLSQRDISHVLYIDIDIHHGDGVEESFLYDNTVTTVSFHLAERGFYPGTGHEILPRQEPAYCGAIRIPLHRGIRNDAYIHLFDNVMNTVIDYHQPDVFVLQCGCDGVAGDPLGGFNLTAEAYTACVEHLLGFKIPLLILGGGGYNSTNAAKVWTDVLQTCIEHVSEFDGESGQLRFARDVPLHDDYFDLYGPTFTRDIKPLPMDDENTYSYLRQTSAVVKNIFLRESPLDETKTISEVRNPR